MFLTYEKRRRARTLVECALIVDVLVDMETAEGDDKRARVAMAPASSILGKSSHDRVSPEDDGL